MDVMRLEWNQSIRLSEARRNIGLSSLPVISNQTATNRSFCFNHGRSYVSVTLHSVESNRGYEHTHIFERTAIHPKWKGSTDSDGPQFTTGHFGLVLFLPFFLMVLAIVTS